MGFESSTPELVEDLLNRAKILMDNSICISYSNVERRHKGFLWILLSRWGCPPYPASNELLAAFFAWLELFKRVVEMPTCLMAIAREYK
ncbi:495_t:CDS:1, partial [Dentiscutata erythropus]